MTFLSNRGLLGKNTYYDSLTALIFKKHLNRDSVCVDVGCHKGDILKLMMRHAPEGKFFAFEPIPALYEALREKFKDDPRVSVFNTALSNQAGESSFNYVISHPAFSGLIKRTYYFPNQNDTRITVKTDRLDNIVKDSTVDMIKIDVEGAELQVLQGAKKLYNVTDQL